MLLRVFSAESGTPGSCLNQARSQDLKKGGFFERVRKLQTTLTRIFIVFESESHGLSDFGRFILKIETEISAKIGNSNAFSAQKQMISKKKKVFTEIETDFSANIGNSNAFSGRFTTSTSQLRHPISFEGGVFIFSPKIGLKSTKNVRFCILYTPIWGGSSPPLATQLVLMPRFFLQAYQRNCWFCPHTLL